MKHTLWLPLMLSLAVGCKTDPPAGANGSAAGEAPATKARSAKIDLKPMAPPSLPADDQPAKDPDWRERRKDRLDTDGDGKVSDEERAAAMKQRMGRLHDRLDTDGDGKVSPAELANAPGRFKFDDPAAIDTNHDGDISVDELAAAVKARRDARRAARAAGSGAPGAPAPQGPTGDPDQ